jgi:GMP synthase (glutamine-hydrolysing)
MTKKFLILQARPDEVADFEFEAFLKYGGLKEEEVQRIRMEVAGIPGDINLDEYSAVIVGGGPFNVSDDEAKKSEEQVRLEKDLSKLLDEIIEKDIPYMGACYGFGALALKQNGEMSKEKYAEDVGALTIELTDEGKIDPLFEGLPEEFRVFAGHKEACDTLPDKAVLLGSSNTCPNHIFRMKKNVYATQFHPELDVLGIKKRIDVYKHHGYFAPEDAQRLKEMAEKESLSIPMEILHRFVEMYKQ